MSDLFGGASTEKPKRAAARAQRDAAIPDAPAAARKAHVMTPEEYEVGWTVLRNKIVTPEDADKAMTAWLQQVLVRRAIGVDQKAERMMKAALDGRCNRIKAGIILAGRD